MAIYFSSGSFSGPLSLMLEECEAEGMAGLEFSSGIPFAPDLADCARGAATRDLDFLVHNYFPPPPEPFVLNLASTDAKTLEASRALCRTAMDLAAALGAPFYSVHSGFAMQLSAAQLGQPGAQAALSTDQLIERSDAERIFRESLAELSPYARKKGLGLLIENNVITREQVAAGRRDSLLMTAPTEIRDFLDDLADDNVGVLLDSGHARVAAGALGLEAGDYFSVLEGCIHALHLSDNDGAADSNKSFARDAWFAPFLPRFAQLPMVIEVYRLDAGARRRQFDTLQAMLS